MARVRRQGAFLVIEDAGAPGNDYDILVRRIDTPDGLAEQLRHLRQKRWFDQGLEDAFLGAVRDLRA